MRPFFSIVFFATLTMNVAHAFPDGAPWGSADPNAPQNCTSCHYDGETVMDSAAITLTGLPEHLSPGAAYLVVLTFIGTDGAKAGMLITATGGEFNVGAGFLIEKGSEIRSIRPKKIVGEIKWQMRWHAPEEIEENVTFFIAVNASNDDQSPFGDEIHFKSVTVDVERGE